MAVNSLTLSARIYIQQLVLLVTIIGLGVLSIVSLNNIDQEVKGIHDYEFPLISYLTEVETLQLEADIAFEKALRIGELQLISQKRVNSNKDYSNEFKKVVNRFNELEAQLHQKVSENIQELNLLLNDKENTNTANIKDIIDELHKVEKVNDMFSEKAQSIFDQFSSDEEINMDEVEHEIELVEKQAEEITHELEAYVRTSNSNVKSTLDDINIHVHESVILFQLLVTVIVVIALVMVVFTTMTLRNLRSAVDRVNGSVQQVATAAAQTSNAINMVSDGAKSQSESINQAVTAVEQSAAVLGDVSSSAEKATEVARDSASSVESGKAKMDAMVKVVNNIKENSVRVNKITEIISNIAGQTNMLALNAAIEAARAGEQGKGFAVVAEQVKSLAESSKESVDEIVELIEQAKIDASQAFEVASLVQDEMTKIAEAAIRSESMMQSISTAMEEQVSTTEELSHNMDTLRDIGANNANSAEEITETVIELSRLSSDTNIELKKFNI